MKIIFMGTPSFAVASLDALVKANFEVVAVVTAPDKPTGRGQKMSISDVKAYAMEHDIPVLQPEKLRNPEFLEALKDLNADLQIVVAFRMLPEVVWSMPRFGTVNLHGSLLPQYRGAAPINWAIINGETETGVTTFFIEKEIDTGNIIFSKKNSIAPNDTAGSLHDKMMYIGGELLVKTVQGIASNNYPSLPQDFSKELKSAPKIFKETCKIDWNKGIKQTFDFIRGLSPYPAAWTYLGEKVLKIYDSEIFEGETTDFDKIENLNSTIVLTDHKKNILFKTSDGYLNVKSLQLEGKKRLQTEEFLRGFRF